MTEKKIPERSEIQFSDTWDLTKLYSSDDHWETDFKIIDEESGKYSTFMGRLDESAEIFREAVEYDLLMSRRLEKVYTYSHLKSDEDKANQKYLGMQQRAMNLYVRVSELSSFLTPEIQSIPDSRIAAFLEDKNMELYRYYLEKILRYKPHTLSTECEHLLAMTGEMEQAPSEIFEQLDNADLKFGSFKDDRGNIVELSHGNFTTFLTIQDREIRQQAFFQYYKSYDDHRNTLSASLASSIKKDRFYTKARKYGSCMESSLFPDNVPSSIYESLISAVKGNLSPLFKYFNFRKGALGLDNLHMYDTYVPIIKQIDFKMPFDEATDICLKAMAPLGEEYVSILKNGFSSRWVDRYESRGKRSGAYSSGCFDSPPYILMNYDENNINSLYTLIHEAGHSMHSHFSKTSQPYLYYRYSIFVAEVASTFNETLLSNYLINYYDKDNDMKAYIINREIDNIRSTIYRQTMFAEFEKITHDIADKGEALTLEVMQNEYRKLLETYFGNTMIIDDALTLEFLRIPHFYSSFYVYKYSTGIAAAIALADRVIRGVKGAKEDYLDFLKMGSRAYPLEELRGAGVDMNTPEPVKNALLYFDSLVEKLISLFNKA